MCVCVCVFKSQEAQNVGKKIYFSLKLLFF